MIRSFKFSKYRRNQGVFVFPFGSPNPYSFCFESDAKRLTFFFYVSFGPKRWLISKQLQDAFPFNQIFHFIERNLLFVTGIQTHY